MYLAISQQQGYQGFFDYGVYFCKTLYFFNFEQYNYVRNKHVALM